MPSAQILIVEDERIIAAELTRRITRLGYTVVATAGSGVEAIERAQASAPDLVLMDIGLPGEMNGLEAGARIWEMQKIPNPLPQPRALAIAGDVCGAKT